MGAAQATTGSRFDEGSLPIALNRCHLLNVLNVLA